MAKLPKRVTNLKKKEKRQRSWAKNQEAKKARIAEQQKREKRNKELGTTAKQRANAARKEKQEPVTQEDLLEQ
jgi:hypothetical protein